MSFFLTHLLAIFASCFNHDDFPRSIFAIQSTEQSTNKLGSQPERTPDCGVATVYCLLRTCGRNVTVKDVEETFLAMGAQTNLSAISMQQLVAVLGRYSVESEAVRLSDASLDEIKLPAVLHFPRTNQDTSKDGGHFVVLMSVSKSKVRLIDLTLPHHLYEGIGEMNRASLEKHWKGDAVILRSSMAERIESLITSPFVSALLWVVALTVVSWRFLRSHTRHVRFFY